MVVPKKNKKVRVYVDYWKLNAVMVTDLFPLLFTNGVLDALAGHEIYSFLDGFSGYNQIWIHQVDQEKTTFVIEWGVFIRCRSLCVRQKVRRRRFPDSLAIC